MSLTAKARATMERYARSIQAISPDDIESAIYQDEFSQFRDDVLSLGADGDYRVFYAPFDWVNDHADIVIVGVTPGKQQATEGLQAMRSALASGANIDEAARRAKQAASFKGTMRTLGARLMDHFRLNELFGLPSTIDLFGKASNRAHYTSAVRYPVLKNFKNYSGDKNILKRALLASVVNEHLPDELRSLPNAWIVPFGTTAHRVMREMANRGVIAPEQILGGILHPNGSQWNRYNVQLDLVDKAAAADVPGGLEVLRVSAELRERVKHLLRRPKAA